MNHISGQYHHVEYTRRFLKLHDLKINNQDFCFTPCCKHCLEEKNDQRILAGQSVRGMLWQPKNHQNEIKN